MIIIQLILNGEYIMVKRSYYSNDIQSFLNQDNYSIFGEITTNDQFSAEDLQKNTWNREIFEFPFKKIVAAKEGRTTRIPFIAEKEIKNKARGVFF